MRPTKATYDLIVLGAGAGGLTAATVAAKLGLATLLVEKSAYVGGTTAISGGMIWVPDNHLMHAAGLADSAEAARRYLAATVPDAVAAPKLERYIETAPEAIAFLTRETEVALQPVLRYPDYYPDLPGATPGGRVLEPVPFDGRRLGAAFAWLRPPHPAFTILGGMMVSRGDIPHFRRFARAAGSTWRVLRLVLRHLGERLSHDRGTTLVLGNALAGRLLLSALEAGVELCRSVEIADLVVDNGRCVGVRLAEAAGGNVIAARRGVVLATGGFAHDPELRRRLMPKVADEVSASAETATGAGLRLAETAGAAVVDDAADPAMWVPVSRYRGRDGRPLVYPHTVTDRSKPGAIAVDDSGRRFVNEALSYHEFVRAMLASPNGVAMRAHLICDSRFLWRYGLGAVLPFSRRPGRFLASGYLKRAASIEALGTAIGVDAHALAETVRRYNAAAVRGEDPDFGRGSDAYQRHLGDVDVAPNPCLAPIDTPPFYAVELRPGDLGTAAGIATDASGRVLAPDGQPIGGLFAVGNDAASIMRGHYPGPGITLGPALTYGYLAARAAASGSEC
ncbi:MAG: FAD-dependent oxidoreductase [Hyphomicrobiaceae bacterium]